MTFRWTVYIRIALSYPLWFPLSLPIRSSERFVCTQNLGHLNCITKWPISVPLQRYHTSLSVSYGIINSCILTAIYISRNFGRRFAFECACNKQKNSSYNEGKSYLHERKKMYLKNDTNQKYSTDGKNVSKKWQKSIVPKMYLKSGRNQ